MSTISTKEAKNYEGSEKDITQKIDTDVLTTEELPTNDDDNYVRDLSETKHEVKNFEGSDFDVTTNTKSHEEKHTSRSSYSTGGGIESKESDVTKKFDSDAPMKGDVAKGSGVKSSRSYLGKYHVKTVDEEVEDALQAARGEVSKGWSDAGGAADRAGDRAREGKDNVAGAAEGAKDDVVGAAKGAAGTVKVTAGDIKGEAGEALQGKTAQVSNEASAKAEKEKRHGKHAGKVTQDEAGLAAAETKERAKGLFGGFQNILGEASAVIQDTVNAPGEHITNDE